MLVPRLKVAALLCWAGCGFALGLTPVWAQIAAVRMLSGDERAFAQALSQTGPVPLEHITRLLEQAQINPRVRTLIQPPEVKDPASSAVVSRRSWPVYRQRFVNVVRIAAGLAFWQQHRETLNTVAAEYGVPPSIIVAIIGVETRYGQHTGDFPVLDTLYTLAFHHPEPARPQRVQLFREQLADLIELDYTGILDAGRDKGSFAGALGLVQFMPGSIKRFARDGDGDGRIDLFNSPADAIASVANFLREHSWQKDLPVFAPVALPEQAQMLATHGLEATSSWQDLQAQGAAISSHGSSDNIAPAWQQHKLGVIPLVDEVAQTTEYRTVTPNFYALTQYNRSYFYAAVVADLAQALQAASALANSPTSTASGGAF